MKAKICGLTTLEQVQTCIDYKANFCGFILNYKKSHRYINKQVLKEITNVVKKNTSFVGVLVEPTRIELEEFSVFNLDYFQIYGEIDKDQVTSIKNLYNKKIIMTIQIKKKEDILKYKKYEDVADIILFDSSGLHKSLSWNYGWIKKVPNSVTKMLAGNLDADMLENLKEITDIVDVSGALETDKVKDLNKIKNFLNKVNQIND